MKKVFALFIFVMLVSPLWAETSNSNTLEHTGSSTNGGYGVHKNVGSDWNGNTANGMTVSYPIGYIPNSNVSEYEPTFGTSVYTTTTPQNLPTIPKIYNQSGRAYAFAFSNTYNAYYQTQIPPNTTAFFNIVPSATETFVFLSPTTGSAILNFCNYPAACGNAGMLVYGFSNTTASMNLSATIPIVGSYVAVSTCTGPINVPGTFLHYINANSCTISARYDYTAPVLSGTTKPVLPPF